LTRLESVAAEIERLGGVPRPVRAGWAAFRDALHHHHHHHHHHAAEDDDLWPVMRTHLTNTEDRREVDVMVEEHRAIPAAIDAVDAALSRGVDVISAAVMAELPRPARAIYRWVLRPRYLAEQRWQPVHADDANRRDENQSGVPVGDNSTTA